MDLRLVQLYAPRGVRSEIKDTLLAYKTWEVRETNINTKTKNIQFFATSAGATELLAIFEKRFHNKEWFRIILSPVEATLPRIEEEDMPDKKLESHSEETKKTETKKNTLSSLLKIHPEELYQKVLSGTELSINKTFLYIVSAIVATIGLAYNNVAIIIWSMVIAPFLWPNVGLALGTTLGDKTLITKGLKNILIGTWLVLSIAIVIGYVYTWTENLVNQVFISLYMIVLSFVSWVSAILYLLEHNDSGLVGVMVAVSLLPPLTLTGLLLGAGIRLPAFKAFLLFLANIVCLNLAGISTFIFAGVRPSNRREIKKAREKTKIAVWIWSTLLVLLVVLTYFFTK